MTARSLLGRWWRYDVGMEFLLALVGAIVVGGLILWLIIGALQAAATSQARDQAAEAHLRMLRAQVNDQMRGYMAANDGADLDAAAGFGAEWLTKYYGLAPQQARWVARSAIREACGFDPFAP